ncbi:MAG: hypothetical protein C0599_00960 [Salinivirgaceae bacterium]|nr:MAG: hypothetical protein C0599_00960 [Salinivirgaceae bacterium]
MNFIPLTFYSLSFFMIVAYAFIVIRAISGLKKLKFEDTIEPVDIAIDVIIPFHNEIENLPHIVKSLQDQTHHNYRIIWVNDHSTDNSLQYLQNNSDKLESIFLNSPKKGKKAAISYGIQFSDAKFIVFTDADVIHHPKWIESYVNAFHKKGEGLFFGPVIYRTNSFIENIFRLDFLSLMGTGMGLAGSGNPIYMNGANYGISKKLVQNYYEKTANNYASGDDVFLLHHIKKVVGTESIYALNSEEILVETPAPKTLCKFIKQRIRWGGKTTGYKDLPAIALAIIVFGISFLQIASLFLLSFSIGVLSIWIAKIFIDLIAIINYSKFWEQSKLTLSFTIMTSLYPFYIVSTAIIGLFSNKSKWS